MNVAKVSSAKERASSISMPKRLTKPARPLAKIRSGCSFTIGSPAASTITVDSEMTATIPSINMAPYPIRRQSDSFSTCLEVVPELTIP